MQHSIPRMALVTRQRDDHTRVPEQQAEQAGWFMVEEYRLGGERVRPESYQLEELLRRFPNLLPLFEGSTQAFSGCSWAVQGPNGVTCIRIYPDE